MVTMVRGEFRGCWNGTNGSDFIVYRLSLSTATYEGGHLALSSVIKKSQL